MRRPAQLTSYTAQRWKSGRTVAKQSGSHHPRSASRSSGGRGAGADVEEAAAARDELFRLKQLAFGGEAHDAPGDAA